MSWPVAFFILLGVAATTAALTLTEPEFDTHVSCEEIAGMSPDEFRVWFGPQDIRTLPQVLACVLGEARR